MENSQNKLSESRKKQPLPFRVQWLFRYGNRPAFIFIQQI